MKLLNLFRGLTLFVLLCKPLSSYGCNDSKQVYKICSSQTDIFAKALAEAQHEKKIILVNFGAEWCPWCHSLHRLFNKADFMSQFKNKLKIVEIGMYIENEKLVSGYDVLNDLIKKSGQKIEMKGLPFLALVAPSGKEISFIDTGSLELNTKTSKGHDSKKVAVALTSGIETVLKSGSK